MPRRTTKPHVLGFLAGLCWPRVRCRRPSPQDLQRADVSTSTQRWGLRFTEYVRDTFRFRWIKPRN